MFHNEPLAGMERQSTCCLCGDIFLARHNYGLCPQCCSKDLLREWDRVESAKFQAERRNIVATLTLPEWLATVSDFKGLCAFCQNHTYNLIERVDSEGGLTYDNVVPACRPCSDRRAEGYEKAESRVRSYLSIEKGRTA